MNKIGTSKGWAIKNKIISNDNWLTEWNLVENDEKQYHMIRSPGYNITDKSNFEHYFVLRKDFFI